ncbi:hypothetical protein, partial [Acidianus sp. RZ1]
YIVPLSEETKVKVEDNDKVPPLIIPLEGKFRLVFMKYNTFTDIENAIKSQIEDDLIIEVEKGVIINEDKKRNIFMDYRSVEKMEESRQIVSYLMLPGKYMLLSAIIANNVENDNIIEIRRKEDNVLIDVIRGLAKSDNVLRGDTLTLREKAFLYYDVKTKGIIKEEILKSIAWKIASI